MSYRESVNSLQQSLGLTCEPITITFHETIPFGVERIGSAAPAGCAYWRLAADGQVFYTVGDDHLNCPIGAYTHGVELTAGAQDELEGMIQKMVGLQYLRIEELAGIPRRKQAPQYIVYAPLSKTQGGADVVLLRGNARQMMLVVEAANARSLMSTFPVMGRPACAVIATCIESGAAATSLGCIGNRVYTQLSDNEFYVALPGRVLAETVEAIKSIAIANSELEAYHRGRCACA